MARSVIEESDSDSDHSNFLVNINKSRRSVLTQPDNPQSGSARGSESSDSPEPEKARSSSSSSSSSNESGFFTAVGPSGPGMALYSSPILFDGRRGGIFCLPLQ